MSSSKTTVEKYVAQLAGAGDVTARAMFGEWSIYVDGKLAALVCDDVLYIKATDAGRAFAGKITESPPYPGAKPALKPWGKQLKDGAWLTELVAITAKALPAPKAKKKPKKS